MEKHSYHYMRRLDHLRFFAAALVVVHHFYHPGKNIQPNSIENFIKMWIDGGAVGVSLFLVLTGFLFSVITNGCQSEIKYGSFVKSRILRIAPLSVFLLLFLIVASRQDFGPLGILRFLTLQFNTGHQFTGWGQQYFPVGPMWTIAVEFQFYLLFPLLCSMIRREGIRSLLLVMLCFLIFKLVVTVVKGDGIYFNLYHTLAGRFDQFAIGMLLGVMYVNGLLDFVLKSRLVSAVFLFLGVAIATGVIWSFNPGVEYNTLSFLFEAIAFSFIIISYMKLGFPALRNGYDVFAKLGALSFSIYLLHLPIGVALRKAFHMQDSWELGVSTLLVSTAVAVFTYNGIEKPFLKMKVAYKNK